MSNKNTEYPVTKETMHAFAESLFAPIRRGENVTTVWVPMAGRRMWSKFIIENIDLFKKELPNYEKYVLVYVEPLDLTEESLSGYLRLMATSFLEACTLHKDNLDKLEKYKAIFNDEDATYASLLAALKEMLSDAIKLGYEVIFFLGEFDELEFANKVFYNNLKSVWNQLYPSLHYVFLMREGVVKHQNIVAFGDFSEVILQNIVHVKMLGDKDIDYVANRIAEQLQIKMNDNNLQKLKEICGGHAYTLKVAIRVLANYDSEKLTPEQIEKLLWDHYELKSVSRGILEVLDKDEERVLARVGSEKKLHDEDSKHLQFLMDLGLVVVREGERVVFNELVKRAVLENAQLPREKNIEKSGLSVDQDTQAILFNSETVEENFTSQEYNLLKMFIENANKLRTRDDIGEVLWGKDSYEKYSDWAIDQLISKLRKKLKGMHVREKLVTIRGKGYKLTKTK